LVRFFRHSVVQTRTHAYTSNSAIWLAN